jgi:hypothetical protein
MSRYMTDPAWRALARRCDAGPGRDRVGAARDNPMTTKRQRSTPPSKMGRPSDYDHAYCEQVVSFCAQGYSLTAFAGEIGVCRDTISEWCRKHPEFSASV